MVHVETIDLSARGVTFPRDRVGMVMAQPHMALTPVEPFQCLPERRQQQLGIIERTLEIARANPHGEQRTHFTIFPEFSILGLDGVAVIDAALQSADWPACTIVIGGVEGLSRPDYLTLIGGQNTVVHSVNSADHVAADQWVNCAVIWVKGANNVVERWIQPKIHPSRPENDAQLQRMFQGGCVYLFKGRYETGSTWYRFSTLICFDWIATVQGHKPWQWLLQSLDAEGRAREAPVQLTWMFVIQHNPKPSHRTFLGELTGFFNQTDYDAAGRNGTCIIFANNAGRNTPGRTSSFGFTSLVLPSLAMFTPPKCYPTYSNGGPRFRGSDLIRPHHEVLFRECGQCIHSFVQVNPNSLIPGAEGHAIPVENPFVHPVNPAELSPRAPGAVVQGAVKWWNDSLDQMKCLSHDLEPSPPLSECIEAAHSANLQELRTKDAVSASNALKLSDPNIARDLSEPTICKHADEWDQTQTDALNHVVDTLDILRVGFQNTTTQMDGAHGIATIRGNPVQIVAVRGATHQQNQKHADQQHVPLRRRQLIIVSRDKLNTPMSRRSRRGTIFGAKPDASEAKFNDPSSNRIYVGFQELLTEFTEANSPDELEGGICARLA